MEWSTALIIVCVAVLMCALIVYAETHLFPLDDPDDDDAPMPIEATGNYRLMPDGFEVNGAGFSECPRCSRWSVSVVDGREYDRHGDPIDLPESMWVECFRCHAKWPTPHEYRLEARPTQPQEPKR